VHGAIVALCLALAHRVDGPKGPRERLLATLPTIRALALGDPKAPALHLALGGLLSIVEEAVHALEPSFEQLDAPTFEAWKRDRALFSVAATARAARLEAAWASSRISAPPR
jgi:hypothetical protein